MEAAAVGLDAVGTEAPDERHLTVNQAKVMREKVHVGHAHGMPFRSEASFAPALGRAGTGGLIGALPLRDHHPTALLMVVKVGCEWPDQIDVIEDRGAHEPVAPHEERHVGSAVLQCRAALLDGVRPVADDDDASVGPREAHIVAAQPSHDWPCECELTLKCELARKAESAVGAKQCEPVRRERKALGGRVRASAPPAADADGAVAGVVVASAAHDRDARSQVQLSLELVLDDEPTDVVDDLVEV